MPQIIAEAEGLYSHRTSAILRKREDQMRRIKLIIFLEMILALLKEYEIFDSTNMIKLDAMENPFDLDINFEITGLPSGATSLNRYPDADCQSIRNKLLIKYQLDDKK